MLGFGGRGRPAFNLVLSNVPGPAEPRYLDGSRMEELFPVSLLFNGQALNITAVSYDGQFNIGYTGCRDSVPSLQRIAVYSGDEVEALEVALGLAVSPVRVVDAASVRGWAGRCWSWSRPGARPWRRWCADCARSAPSSRPQRAAHRAARGRPQHGAAAAAGGDRRPSAPYAGWCATASKVREHGHRRAAASSIEDLQAWAASEQQEIVSMAAADGRVTLLFSDIEDSTPLNERLGDDTWVRVLAAHDALRARPGRAATAARSSRPPATGSWSPSATPRPPAALRSASRRTCAAPSTRCCAWSRRSRCASASTPAGHPRDGDYFGRNVAMAARVGALATGGEVLATDAVHEALDDDAAVELVEMGEVELKGLPGNHASSGWSTR